MWKILILEWIFVAGKFKQIAKIGFGRKNQLSCQRVHIVKFLNFQF